MDELRVQESEIEKKKFLDRLSKKISDNGVITIELKNQYTKQTFNDAIKQYKTDRSQGDLLFSFKRCIVHFAVDDNEVHMCTNICGDKSFFLPFNKGFNNGAGNPPNPDGIKTDYLWKEIFSKPVLSNILENYVQIIEEKDEDTGKKSYKQIRNTIKQFMQVSNTVGWAKDASTLKDLMDEGKKIIITIVHKFQFILDAISDDYKNKNFAIIIDDDRVIIRTKLGKARKIKGFALI